MKLGDYLKKKQQLAKKVSAPREYCPLCLFTLKTCYCSKIKPFDPKIKFVILIHQLEIDRKIATGRLSHLILDKSELIPGHDYTLNQRVNELVQDDQYYPVVLFPGEGSINLTPFSFEKKQSLFPQNKTLLVFVIDGTWATARQTMRMSSNLTKLTRISFELTKLSNFRVRKQPKPEFCSTVEAIHQTIELLGSSRGFAVSTRLHDNLIDVFNYMVEQQLSFYA